MKVIESYLKDTAAVWENTKDRISRLAISDFPSSNYDPNPNPNPNPNPRVYSPSKSKASAQVRALQPTGPRAGALLLPPMRAWLEQPHGRRHKAPPQPCALTTTSQGPPIRRGDGEAAFFAVYHALASLLCGARFHYTKVDATGQSGLRVGCVFT